MARVKIPIAVIDPNGTAVQGASVAVKKRSDGSNAVLFQAETGPTTITNPTPTDAVGRVQAWVDRGSYNAIISGTGITTYTQAFEGAPAADRSVDSVWLPVGVDAPLLGALPSSPVDGQRIYYLADASNGIIWTLRYRAYALDGVTVNPSPYKWEVLGQPTAIHAFSAPAVSTNSGTYVALTTPISVTTPLAGDYDVEISADIGPAGNGQGNFLSFVSPGGVLDVHGIGVYLFHATARNDINIRQSNVSRITGFPAGHVIQDRAKSASTTITSYSNRRLRLIPIRVG